MQGKSAPHRLVSENVSNVTAWLSGGVDKVKKLTLEFFFV
jgi:hypothetical protein